MPDSTVRDSLFELSVHRIVSTFVGWRRGSGPLRSEYRELTQRLLGFRRVVRIDEMPQIEVHIVPSAEAPGGIGEPGTVTVQGALNNAIYAATGIQLSRMPIDSSLLSKKAWR